MGRVKSAERNIVFGYLGQIATAIMSFVLRTIFISRLSEVLLGVNSTYTNILSLLSMAELGIGTALNFALYAPVAKGDTEKIKSYMRMYRKCYHVIGLIVAAAGCALAPFLPWLVKKPGSVTVQELTIYYFIFLFNTVSTYFVTYKYSLVNAEQKNYIQTNINTATKIIAAGFQIAALIFTNSFLVYLLTDAAVQLIQKIFVSVYLDRLYPYLKDKDAAPLTKEESGMIWQKTKALVLHKVGDAARLQTDAIIISSMIEVTVSGMVDNYNIVISTVSNFVNIIFNSVISSFGNLIATENKERQYELFRVYRFFACWVYGFSAVGFFTLLTPLIRLWVGDSWVLPTAAVSLILLDYYFKGDRIVNSNFKTAAGVFEQDKYLAMIQGIVNLILSVCFVKMIGLAGVYVGTVVSGLIANVTKPFIIYRYCFDRSPASYFRDSVRYFALTAAVTVCCLAISSRILQNLTIMNFLLMAVIVTVLFNGLFILLFHRTKEFGYLKSIAMNHLHR